MKGYKNFWLVRPPFGFEQSRASEIILILERELASKTNMEVIVREDYLWLEDEIPGLRSKLEAVEEKALANN